MKEEVQVLLEELKKQDFKDRIVALGLLPAPKEDPLFSKFFQETVPDEIKEKFKESFERPHVLFIVSDEGLDQNKKLELRAKAESTAINIVKEKKLNLWIDTFTTSEIVQLAMDSHFEIFDLMAKAEPIYDPKELLSVMRMVVLHRNMVLQKFDRYVVCYVIAGSYIRGEAGPKSDVDTYAVIDDTDVKRHTPWELKQKLLAIIGGMAIEAQMATGSKRPLHVQVYTLTEFWKSLKEVNPVIVTFLRDGVPLYDKGLFIPWKLLLKRGEIKPSPEAIDSLLRTSDELISSIKSDFRRMFLDKIYWAIVSSAQAVFLAKKLLPPAPKEIVRLAKELDLIEEEYLQILEETIKLYKGYEHGEVSLDLKGKDIDEWLEKAEKFVKHMKELTDLYSKEESKIELKDMMEQVNMLLFDTLRLIGYDVNRENVKEYLEDAVKKGLLPEKILDEYNKLLEIKDPDAVRSIVSDLLKELQKRFEAFLTEKLMKRRIALKVNDLLADLYYFDDYILLRFKEDLYQIILEGEKVKEVRKIDRGTFERLLIEGKITKPAVLNEEIMKTLERLIGKFDIIF